jgi:hypothetical protein
LSKNVGIAVVEMPNRSIVTWIYKTRVYDYLEMLPQRYRSFRKSESSGSSRWSILLSSEYGSKQLPLAVAHRDFRDRRYGGGTRDRQTSHALHWCKSGKKNESSMSKQCVGMKTANREPMRSLSGAQGSFGALDAFLRSVLSPGQEDLNTRIEHRCGSMLRTHPWALGNSHHSRVHVQLPAKWFRVVTRWQRGRAQDMTGSCPTTLHLLVRAHGCLVDVLNRDIRDSFDYTGM